MYMTFFFMLFQFFHNKISVLLCLEGLFIVCILKYSIFSNGLFISFFFLFVFSVFMVLDSVFGVTLLVGISRFSGCHSSWIFFDHYPSPLFLFLPSFFF